METDIHKCWLDSTQTSSDSTRTGSDSACHSTPPSILGTTWSDSTQSAWTPHGLHIQSAQILSDSARTPQTPLGHVGDCKLQCQVWQAFVQESVRSIAAMSGSDLVLPDGLAIDEVTKEAFKVLGAYGRIAAAP